MSTLIDVNCIVNRENLKANSANTVFVSIDLTPSIATQVYAKSVNIVLAIDCSGSMSGEKFSKVKESAINLIQVLRPQDSVSIISFSNKAKVEASSSKLSHGISIEDIINNLSLGSTTDMYDGLELAYKETKRMIGRERLVSRIILLTDGHPTSGRMDDKDFIDISKTIRTNGVTVVPVGIGDDYNEDLLTKIADSGGGIWYHVEDPGDVRDILSDQITQMSQTVMINPTLQISLMPGSELRDLYKVRPFLNNVQVTNAQNNTQIISLQDLVNGETQTIGLRVSLPGRPPGKFRLAQVIVGDNKKDIEIQYTEESSLYNQESDPYPRVLLASSEATTYIQRGLATGDQTQIRKADTLIKNLSNDPEMTRVLKQNPLIDDLHTVVNKATSVRTSAGGNTKKMLNETTIIGRKPKK